MTYNILIVDDDPLQCRSAELIITKLPQYKAVTINNGKEAIDYLLSSRGKEIDVVLLDLMMPEVDGIDVIRAVRPEYPNLPIVIYTAYGDIQKAVEAINEGASDFLEKQDGPERMRTCIQNAHKMSCLEQEVDRLQRMQEGRVSADDIIGHSAVIKKAKSIAQRAAKSNISVLIQGESGSGKEIFARMIHGCSLRSSKPFIPVNCAAIPDNLVESVLFGHTKGAFTGAIDSAPGKFLEADGGTLFLDEIGELRLDVQSKLLRALQEFEIEPVGGGEHVRVNLRVISATNKNLRKAVRDGEFREDLYYRLNAMSFEVPPLSKRKQDIEELAEYFCEKITTTEHRPQVTISERALAFMQSYHWPGNIRQLQNVLHNAIIMCDGNEIDISHITQALGGSYASTNDNISGASSTKASFLDNKGNFKKFHDIECEIISAALDFYDGHISKVSRGLGIGRSTLYRKMDEYNLREKKEKAVFTN